MIIVSLTGKTFFTAKKGLRQQQPENKKGCSISRQNAVGTSSAKHVSPCY